MLPYASYLRVYEPISALPDGEALIEAGNVAEPATTLGREQRSTLTRIVSSPAPPIVREQTATVYVLRREGRAFLCPADLSLRSWLSLTSLVESVGNAAAGLIYSPQAIATADDDFLTWRRDHPAAVPHIRQSTWGVPRTWFVLVVEEEREHYVEDGVRTARYRARMLDARRRVSAAHRLLATIIDDTDTIEELANLAGWLEAFDPASWVELDYAGVGRLLGDELQRDQSARDIHRAIDALRREDYAAAGISYRSFEERWRVVNAFERAN